MRQYGIIGYPLGHSFSRKFFTEKFSSEAIDAEYNNYELSSLGQFPDIIRNNRELVGLNVTIPHKKEIIKYLDDISDDVRSIGAVNVISVDRSGDRPFLRGFNSDYYGFIQSLKPLVGNDTPQALILGTGGASMAVAYGLSKLNIKFTFVSRSDGKGDLTYDTLTEDDFRTNRLIINTTPAGIGQGFPDFPPINFDFIESDNILYDLVYKTGKTGFIREGEKRGCIVKDGLEMLHLQAVKAWEIWNRAVD